MTDLQDTLAVLQEEQCTKILKRVISIMMNAATPDGTPPWRIWYANKMETCPVREQESPQGIQAGFGFSAFTREL